MKIFHGVNNEWIHSVFHQKSGSIEGRKISVESISYDLDCGLPIEGGVHFFVEKTPYQGVKLFAYQGPKVITVYSRLPAYPRDEKDVLKDKSHCTYFVRTEEEFSEMKEHVSDPLVFKKGIYVTDDYDQLQAFVSVEDMKVMFGDHLDDND